jgi:hypothetical protein
LTKFCIRRQTPTSMLNRLSSPKAAYLGVMKFEHTAPETA